MSDFTNDKVELRVQKFKIASFKHYSMDSSIYTADSMFSFQTYDPELEIVAGDRCEVWIGGVLVDTGIIDRRRKWYSKDDSGITFEGRNLMGLVVDSFCETFKTYKNKTVRAMAEELLKDIPFLSRKNIEYDPRAESADSALEYVQVEPGQRVFDVLRDIAISRGLAFYCRPNGTFVFRKPSGTGDTRFSLVHVQGKNRSRIEHAEDVRDISEQYSRVTVVGQQQGTSGGSASAINTKATEEYSGLPFRRPYVEVNNNDALTPKKRAKMLIEQMRYRGNAVTYSVGGHTQNGEPWAPDELCAVWDDRLEIHETLLVYSRAFSFDKDSGSHTDLTLGPKGVIA